MPDAAPLRDSLYIYFYIEHSSVNVRYFCDGKCVTGHYITVWYEIIALARLSVQNLRPATGH